MGLSSVLFLEECEGEPADRNKDQLTLFVGELDNGTLVEVCQEVSDVCSVDNMGCAAFELLCGGDSEEVICQHLGPTCEMAQQCIESWEPSNPQGQGNIDQFCQQA